LIDIGIDTGSQRGELCRRMVEEHEMTSHD